MATSIEEVKSFCTDARKCREDWIDQAKRSWGEIRRRNRSGKLIGYDYNRSKDAKARFPVWNSTFKIRQPIVFSRIPEPIGLDTTQDGNDPIGSCAAILKERLANGLMKSVNFFDSMAYGRDDFLVTNLGWNRLYFKAETVRERVKQYLQPFQKPETGEWTFVDETGREVLSDLIAQDENGKFFIETDQVVSVENEKICLEPVFYGDVLVDPDVTRWEQVTRLGFEHYYSERQFTKLFGKEALKLVPEEKGTSGSDKDKSKAKAIKVIEYWDMDENEVLWCIDGSDDFITPLDYRKLPEGDKTKGLYNLKGFFPCTKPLAINQSTESFYPDTEYMQVSGLICDIHNIFARMMAVTRSIRARLLFDNNIEGLQEALANVADGDAFGVANLSQALASNGGTLKGVCQYIPIEELITSLQNLYKALEQRLMAYYQLTGTSDLLQGLTQKEEKTLGEQQMKEKYALNQLAQFQYKMQEFARDNIELMCEMALKNFSDEALGIYIVRGTLKPDQQRYYGQALNLLKDDRKGRFRVELETDSMVAINEQYDIEVRKSLVNALTAALEKTAQIAEAQPSLVLVELHALKYLIQGYRQSKLFQNEITSAIDAQIKATQAQMQQQPPVDPKIAIEQKKVQIEEFKANVDAQDKAHTQMIQNVLTQLEKQNTLFEERFKMLQLQMDQKLTSAELQEKWATEARLQKADQREDVKLMSEINAPKVESQNSQPSINVVVPQAPAPNTTIVNTPAAAPNTTVVQPVQTLPIL